MLLRIEKSLVWIIKIGIFGILFLPLFIYRPVLYPYVFSKIIIFQILVEIIFAAWLFLAVYNRKYRPDWKNPLLMSLTLFMGILFLTMLSGADIAKSFFSTQERMTGILTMLHFWVLFIILTSTFKKWHDWQEFILVSVICSFLVGLYGLGQKIGLSFLLPSEKTAAFGQWLIRLSSTLGNSIFLAVYSMLHIFLAGFLLLQKKRRLIRILIVLFLLFNLVILFLTSSRGVLAAFSLAIFLFSIFLIFSLSSQKLKIVFSTILILLIIVTSAGFIFLRSSAGQNTFNQLPTLVKRIVYFTSGAEGRFKAWNIGWQGFKQKPILGFGWENYNIVFNKYYQPFYLSKGQEATWFDRSHNQLIDLLVLTGLFGTVSYLMIFGAVFLQYL